MRVLLYDELPSDYADVVFAPRAYCDECKRRTVYRYDTFGYRYCAEHDEMEVCHADEA